MYFSIKTLTPDPHFSYLLAKNPASPAYNQPFGSAAEGERRVEGSYKDESEYEVVVHNDPVAVMQTLREANRPFYVSAEPYSVNPRNLKGLITALRSAMAGKNTSSGLFGDEEVARPRTLRCVVGPYLNSSNYLRDVFTSAGFAVSIQPEKDVDGEEPSSVMVTLDGTMPLSTFLQKVYVLSMYVTVRTAIGWVSDTQLGSLVNKAKIWIHEMGADWIERIAHRLTAGDRKGKKTFIDGVTPLEEPAEEGAEEPTASTEGMAPEVLDTGKRFHDRRHELILENIPSDAKYIVELGCGVGKLLTRLTRQFPQAKVVGYEADEWDAAKARLRVRSAAIVTTNIVFPYLEESHQEPDALVLTEVIEHLQEDDRKSLMRQVVQLWRPKVFVVTAPNKRYNETWSSDPNFKRHRDHKIEHTPEEFAREVVEPLLLGGYDVTSLAMLPDEEVQPSFVLVARRKTPEPTENAVSAQDRPRWRYAQFKGPDMALARRARDLYSPYHIENTGMSVGPVEMRRGLLHRAFRDNRTNIVTLAPTIAPVEYNKIDGDLLESPHEAFSYYAERGVPVLIAQEKMMGSRCTITVFSSKDAARRCRAPAQIFATSKSGFPFFDEDGPTLGRVLSELAPRMRRDFLIFDCEVLPWAFKAGTGNKGLIHQSFRGPAYAALQYLNYTRGNAENVKKFLQVLSWFDRPGPVTLHPFGILATGNVAEHGRFRDVELGTNLPVLNQMARLDVLTRGSELLFPVKHHTVLLNGSSESRTESFLRWREYTEHGGGEGYVYKPNELFNLYNGIPIQRALKVRGRDYLRLIYGFDYLEKHVFDKLTARNIKKKRALAMYEAELSERMLLAWTHQAEEAHMRAMVAFLGLDTSRSGDIDATL